MAVYLTTEDNPWNPFTNWDEWRNFDIVNRYFTCERISRLAPISDSLPDEINDETLEEAMNILMSKGVINKNGELINYKKVYSNSESK